MNRSLLKLLNLRPSESKLVLPLFMVQLFQGIGVALLFTSANALFLSQFSINELPVVYMLSAVVLLIINYIYSLFEHRFPIQKLMLLVTAFSAVSILFLRILIYTYQYYYAPYILLIWNQVVYSITGSAFWALAALIFNVRESKRTFSVLSAGDTPAKLLGYLSVSALAPNIGIKNLLFGSVICFLLSFILFRNFLRTSKVNFAQIAHDTHAKERLNSLEPPAPLDIMKALFGNRLILFISGLVFIVAASLTVIDFTFLSEVKEKYHSDVALASFLGLFFAAGRFLAMLAKITLTSRLVERLGVIISLMIIPVLLIAFVLFVLGSEIASANIRTYLYVFGAMVLITEILKSTIQEPLVLVLFQPLKPSLRLRGHSIAKGVMATLGLFFAGAFIFFSIQKHGGLPINTACYVLLAMCLTWILIVYLLDRQYVSSIIDSLKSGVFRGNFMLKNDEAVKDVLMEKMTGSKALEVIYAADTLQKLDPIAFQKKVEPLLNHESATVKMFALKKIQENKWHQYLPEVAKMLQTDLPDELKKECVATLSGFPEEYHELLNYYLDDENSEVQYEAIAGFLNSGDIHSIIKAGQKLIGWMESDKEEDRIRAADIIAKVPDKNFYTSLLILVRDPSVEVQKHALAAAAAVPNEKLIPLLIEKLKQKETSKAAEIALSKHGTSVFHYLSPGMRSHAYDQKLSTNFIRVAVKIGGEDARTFLEDILLSKPELKHEALSALAELKYSAPSLKHQYLSMIHNELDHAARLTRYSESLEKGEQTAVLQDALQTEIKLCETNIFYLLSFIYDRNKILKSFENIKSGNPELVANATEAIDLEVPKNICGRIISVIEYIHVDKNEAADWSQKKTVDLFHQLQVMLEEAKDSLNSWTKSVIVYTMHRLNPKGNFAFLKKFPDSGEPIFDETRNFVLNNSQ